jgi:hypothetical protein
MIIDMDVAVSELRDSLGEKHFHELDGFKRKLDGILHYHEGSVGLTPGNVSAESSCYSTASFRSDRSVRLPMRDPRHTRRRKMKKEPQDFFMNSSRTALSAAPTDLVRNREILYPIITSPRPVTMPAAPERPHINWHSQIWQHAPEEEEEKQETGNPNLVLPPPSIPLLRTQSMCPLLHRVPSWQVPDLDGAPMWIKFMDDTHAGCDTGF